MTRLVRALVTPALAAGCATALPTSATPPAAAPPPAAAAAQPGLHAVTPLGVELVYDARARTFAVADRPGVWWLDGAFFRQESGNWQTSERLDGPWSPCSPADLPEGLRTVR